MESIAKQSQNQADLSANSCWETTHERTFGRLSLCRSLTGFGYGPLRKMIRIPQPENFM
jgi:PIN domain nuclease of toxin-antitoxin system